MINFFRKIRKKLADDNKPLKYMRYAVGEIALVVIGILIAIQINNWNKAKESKMDEIRILMNLEESLRQNLLSNQIYMKENMRVPVAIDFILNYMEKNLKYHDSLKYQFGNTTMTFPITLNSNVFQSLKSKDFDLISNDSLKNQIISLYNNYDQITKRHNLLYMDIIQEASRNIFNSRFDVLYSANYDEIDSRFEIDKLNYAMVPNDFEKLKKDKEYLYFLKSLKNQFYWYVAIPDLYLETQMKQLLRSIEIELKFLKD